MGLCCSVEARAALLPLRAQACGRAPRDAPWPSARLQLLRQGSRPHTHERGASFSSMRSELLAAFLALAARPSRRAVANAAAPPPPPVVCSGDVTLQEALEEECNVVSGSLAVSGLAENVLSVNLSAVEGAVLVQPGNTGGSITFAALESIGGELAVTGKADKAQLDRLILSCADIRMIHTFGQLGVYNRRRADRCAAAGDLPGPRHRGRRAQHRAAPVARGAGCAAARRHRGRGNHPGQRGAGEPRAAGVGAVGAVDHVQVR